MKKLKEAKSAGFEVFPTQLGFFPYLWLIYMSLPVINMLREEGWKMGIGFALIGLFLVTYRQLYFAAGTPRFFVWLGIQMSIIFILCMWYHPTYMYMGFFTANFIGWYTDRRKFTISLVLFGIIETIPLIKNASMLGKDLLFMIPFFLIMLFSPFGIRSLNRRQELERELAEANEQIRNLIKGEERMRIARDLHDTLGHTLSLITLKSQLVEKLAAKDPLKAQLEAREIQNTSRAALRQVRELVSDMRTATLPEELLEAQIILESADIQLVSTGDPKLEGISDLAHNILSLCLREAVTNVVKHSQASQCRIDIESLDNEWRLLVADNGIGLKGNDDGASSTDSNGLKGMAERLSLIGGTVEAVSDPQGTKLSIRVPVIIKNRKEDTTHEHQSADSRGPANAARRSGFLA
ncbi:sensor histidine kinase [Paenibacillus sp. Y412MC10]|uniref:sensor histidine kinase n=1 Tax=Geobacillus sp. (strain Y412MC10) TaxID=481743 RepID=UPI0001788BA7|nr:sensor histidine kinase [Paenibacillus sp. Y412MC10]ACX62484.1 integral membrane sensor signal transduction histidine kinase [Paenibacillus sp. Y412MC10]